MIMIMNNVTGGKKDFPHRSHFYFHSICSNENIPKECQIEQKKNTIAKFTIIYLLFNRKSFHLFFFKEIVRSFFSKISFNE